MQFINIFLWYCHRLWYRSCHRLIWSQTCKQWYILGCLLGMSCRWQCILGFLGWLYCKFWSIEWLWWQCILDYLSQMVYKWQYILILDWMFYKSQSIQQYILILDYPKYKSYWYTSKSMVDTTQSLSIQKQSQSQ